MDTLHDFFFFTKSIEYLISALFLIAFTYLFLFLMKSDGPKEED